MSSRYEGAPVLAMFAPLTPAALQYFNIAQGAADEE